ncbi:MAG: hypothetical protein NVS4B10_03890 [Myxococcales bacterium]
MRTFNSAFRLSRPLVAAGCAALVGACSPSAETTKYGTPQINNIYAIDLENGLPNVLMYSNPAASGSDPRVSTKPPPAYSAFQVEFDQPMSGPTLANREDRATKALANSSFCSDLTSSGGPGAQGVTLLDGTTPIPASVCYDPTSDIGGNPHVTIIPGTGLSTGTPFTCQTFSRAKTNGVGIFAENHAYALAFKPGIKGASGQALQLPTGTGWTSSQYAFTTAGMALMAAGFQDPVTTYYSFLEKPYPGFIKDLNEAGKAGPSKTPATCRQDSDCQLTQQAAPGTPTGQFGQICAAGTCAYRQQVSTFGGAQTPTPFLIFTTEVVDKATLAGASGVTVTRGTPAAPGAAFPGVTVDTSFDKRVITVIPAATWESGTTYTVTVPATVAGKGPAGTSTLGTAKSFTFTAGTTDLAALTPPTPDENSTGNLVDATVVAVTYPVPLDPAKAVPATSATGPGVKLLKGSALVPIKSGGTNIIDPGTNNQIITITPTGNLDAGTVYTVSLTGLTSSPATGSKPVKDYTYNFTTRFFNAVDLVDATTTSIDRSFKASPTALQDGITVVYGEPAANISASTVKVFEGSATGTPLSVTVTPFATNNANDSATITSSAPAKFGQKYVVQSTTALVSVRGATLAAEGCQPGASCPDLKSFTTAPFGGTLKVTDTTAGTFTFTFNNPVDPTTLSATPPTSPNPQPGSTDAFQLFKQDTATGKRSPVPISCTSNAGTATANTVVTCTAVNPVFASSSATANVTYIANVGIAAPGVKSTNATAKGVPVVPATFTGGATASFATPCFP